jgi:hypothetical protein
MIWTLPPRERPDNNRRPSHSRIHNNPMQSRYRKNVIQAENAALVCPRLASWGQGEKV